MNENGMKKREWVKTAAIIFLSVMLVLTFFSNTIQNYSLPEVAAEYVQSGTITAKVRGTGIIESGDPYEVLVQQSRKIQSVAVRVGDKVEKGDVILYLENVESEELKTAKDALEAAEDAYNLGLLSADVTNSMVQDTNTSTATYRQQITDAQNAVAAEQKNVDELQKKVNDLAAKIALLPDNSANASKERKAFNEAKAAKESADFALTGVQNNLTAIEAQLEYEKSQIVSGGDADADREEAIKNLTEMKNQAQLEVISAQTAAAQAALAYDQAKTALDNKLASGDNSGSKAALQLEQTKQQLNLDAATAVLNEKKDALSNLTKNINQTLNLQNLYDTVVKAREEVEKQTEKTQDAAVTADIAGTITSLNVVAGQTTTPQTPVAVLQPEGKGYTMSMTVSAEQAKRLSAGDRADLVNYWRYDDVEVILEKIKSDPTNPGQQKILMFNVTGDVTAGQSLSISVGEKSANYDLIVPNSAIREDNNGKFILIVEAKNSPLGTRYTATRIDIEVIASDDTKSAISAPIYGYEFVITTSTKPVEAGKLVRLADN